MNPRVSIVIPCFNNGQHIKRAIDSCLNSTFPDIEMIVVNDGSTDPGTLTALHHLNKNKTRVIHLNNHGVSHARNTGIKQSQGQFILSLNADDYIHHTFIEKALRIIEANPKIGFVTSGYQTFGSRGEVWQAPPFQFGRLLVQNIVCESALFRKQAWSEAGGYNENMKEGLEDWDFWISLAKRGWIGGVIPEPLVYRRVDDSIKTHDITVKYEQLVKQIINNHPGIYKQKYFYDLLYNFMRDELRARGMMRRMLGSDYNMDPIVSVVIPCYNYGQFVQETVDSCINSTFQDIEIIVVNNGSTDPYTIDVLNRLSKPKTRVIHVKKNIGLPYGRNTGIKAAKGRYILPVDADDKIHPTLIEKAYRVMEAKPKVGFVTVGLEYFGNKQGKWIPPAFNFNKLLVNNIVCVTSLFRKQAWIDAGGYNESMLDGYEDWDFWISLAEKGWQGEAIPEALLYYRRHGRNMSTEAGKKHLDIVKQIRANHPNLYR